MDLILLNGKVITMDGLHPSAEAVAVKDGKIYAAGLNSEMLALKEDATAIIDLEGKLLVPGFNDSHMHLLSFATTLEKVDLTSSASIDELIEKLGAFISKSPLKPGQWIQGWGWNHDRFDVNRFPTRYDLDRVTTDYPICITRACCHVAVVNSKALEIAGITGDTSQIEGGYFDIDEKGEPLGIFRENALTLVYGKIPVPGVEDIKRLIHMGAKTALAQGITSLQTDDFNAVPGNDYEKILKAYRELDEEKMLPVRINQQCLLSSPESLGKFLKSGYMTGAGTEFFKIGPLKILADGSLGARTAYLQEPYADDPSTRGIPVYTQEEMDNLVITAHKSGMQVAVHCIGDRTMYMAFESIEKAQKEKPRKDARHSIIHCQITDKTLLDKFKDLDVVAHIQPIFLDYDLHIAESRVGAEKAGTSYNWKGMFDRGVHVACGSDCPVEPFNVLKGIYCAVTRKDLKGYPEGGWFPEQKLTIDQALYGFTLGAAYASFEEDIKGALTPGKLADMAVLSEDIYSIDPDSIKDVEVLMTFVGGKLVYKK